MQPPAITLPKGGGAIRGIGEKFSVNPVTGTVSFSIPVFTSLSRAGFFPRLSLSYDSGGGNGPFGLGWKLSIPTIHRKTEKGLPKYQDAEESDVFILSDAEDLVPVLTPADNDWRRDTFPLTIDGTAYTVSRYRPRVEGLFARIEKWVDQATGNTFWKSISRNNETSFYGRSTVSRVFDPQDDLRVFEWLLDRSEDDKGNVILYKYTQENHDSIDPSLPQEANRLADSNSFAKKYLKEITYGKRSPGPQEDFLFRVVFDYGEHDVAVPTPDSAALWPSRLDPFSTFRPGFEVRTYRLCRRVLMFHVFDELGSEPCLVRSTDFTYAENPVASYLTSVSQVGYVRQVGTASYLKKSFPTIELTYSQPTIDPELHFVDRESLENLPSGLARSQYEWVDLDSAGISGILSEKDHSWFYKRNLGKATFAPEVQVSTQPSLANLTSGRQQIMDLAGDGEKCLVQFSEPAAGFYERSDQGRWKSFTTFASNPNVSWNDPNLRLIDLDGDGFSDLLISEDNVFVWYPSLAKGGFGSAELVPKANDEEMGPAIVFDDSTGAVSLADMTGDGLTDIVRIRNGEVCYWPNLGYGRFGAKVSMDTPPVFDAPDQFDPKRIRLVDIDGSGTTDLIYLGRDSVIFWFNQAGNGWSLPGTIAEFPPTDQLANVSAIDLFGNGTGCLVWSSPEPQAMVRPMRYIDLMSGQKPHLLVSVRNNLGAETRIEYAPSTKFYLEDRAAGTPWLTKLPFPVQLVERVEISDRISRNLSITRYEYHHGFYDGIEREFRGFGRIDQWDTEEFAAIAPGDDLPVNDNIDAASHVPPVLTKTWFHNGAYFQEGRISRHFEHEYYREGDGTSDGTGLTGEQLAALELRDTVLPNSIKLQDGSSLPWSLTTDDSREACRALKGSILRHEVYGFDTSPLRHRPYSVSEHNYTIDCLQPHGSNRYAVFLTHAREAVDFHYERKLYQVANGSILPTDPLVPGTEIVADPRVTHAVTLEADAFGNAMKSAGISYGRRFDDPDPSLAPEDRQEQKRTRVTYTENEYTNAISVEDAYRTPLPSETRTYELIHVAPATAIPRTTNLFQWAELQTKTQAASDGQHEIPYEDLQASGAVTSDPYRRIIERSRRLYRRNDLTGPLPGGVLESRALPYESYKLSLTPGLLSTVYQRPRNAPPAENLLPDAATVLGGDGGYVHLEGGGSWWIPSGQMFYSPGANDTFAAELEYAQKHFFNTCRFRDAFQQTTSVSYDEYDLLPVDIRDPLQNRVTAGERDVQGNMAPAIDYRVLQPRLVMDPNRNRSAAGCDALGMVVTTAVMGKPEESLGEWRFAFEADLPDSVALAHLQSPLTNPQEIIGSATTRLVYDLFAYARNSTDPHPPPAVVYVLARETHESDLQPGQTTKYQHSFTYSDGFGREIQQKAQAEPGPLNPGENDVSPRWVGSGWTIFNNKGKPVRQYEPFFSATHHFEFAKIVGVSSILFYDPAERVVATLHPNHTFEKVVLDPWRQDTWDVNDTVLVADPKTDSDTGDFFRRIPDTEYSPTWYAQRQGGSKGQQEQSAANKAAAHANTPAVVHFDALGRPILAVAFNRFARSDNTVEEKYVTRPRQDIEGNQREVVDALGRLVIRYDYDMLGSRIHQASMDAGERWTLNDVTGRPIRSWDSRGHTFSTGYDELRRPLVSYVEGADPQDATRKILFAKTEYGEGQLDDLALNLRTRLFRQFDGAGILVHKALNPLIGKDEAYDFKGNQLRGSRQLAVTYQHVLDWSAAVTMEEQLYVSSTRYDALNRPTELVTPDNSVIRLAYNEAALLERLDGNLRGGGTVTMFVTNIDYDAKGRRILIEYGNGARTQYKYDELTFRLIHLITQRDSVAYPDDCPKPAPDKWPGCQAQNLSYVYDPAGNITYIRDDAQQQIYFSNQRVEPNADYFYDAIYRLIQATGREHLGQASDGTLLPPTTTSPTDAPRVRVLHPSDGNAMGTYVQSYVYDPVGNILEMSHLAGHLTPPQPNRGWTRLYTYSDASLLEAGKVSNRLSRTQVGTIQERYTHDNHGNMTTMQHLPLMQWDHRDQLQATSQQVVNTGRPETTYYVYDGAGQRLRKVTEGQAAAGQIPARKSERVYLGAWEIYREYQPDGTTVSLERETLHVMDDKQRVALIETRTQGSDPSPGQLIRYQLSNHLGSAVLELDDQAQIISYEEFYPYGSTSYQAVQNLTETSKRYRYSGKERDEETGFNYHRARHYATWLGRWTAADPKGINTESNLFVYVADNPTKFIDPAGQDMAVPPIGVVGREIHPIAPQLFLPNNRAELLRDLHDTELLHKMRLYAKPGMEYHFRSHELAQEFYGELTGGKELPPGSSGWVLGASLDPATPRGFLNKGSGTRLVNRKGDVLDVLEEEAGLVAPTFDPIDLAAGLGASGVSARASRNLGAFLRRVFLGEFRQASRTVATGSEGLLASAVRSVVADAPANSQPYLPPAARARQLMDLVADELGQRIKGRAAIDVRDVVLPDKSKVRLIGFHAAKPGELDPMADILARNLRFGEVPTGGSSYSSIHAEAVNIEATLELQGRVLSQGSFPKQCTACQYTSASLRLEPSKNPKLH
jgi:RHS repeat-associated protein